MFTDEQQSIITSEAECILVVAGAGCGKTTTLLGKIEHIRRSSDEPILYLAFNNAVRKELTTKIASRGIRNVQVHTFHSFALQQLRTLGFTLISDDVEQQLLILCAREYLKQQAKHEISPVAIEQLLATMRLDIAHCRPNQIHQAFVTKLRARNQTSLTTMVLDYVELSSSIDTAFAYIMVDEFQDVSADRVQLIDKVKRRNNAKLICVGDDWQSIYAFAGADPQYMIDFETWFSPAEVFTLSQTFRFGEPLLSTSSNLIAYNKHQRTKQLHSDTATTAIEFVPTIRGFPDNLSRVQQALARLEGNPGYDSSLALLCRYNHTIDILNQSIERRGFGPYTQTLTYHRSKGLEFDFVVLLDLQRSSWRQTYFTTTQHSGTSRQGLDLSEERRLLYVGMTRARKAAIVPYQWYRVSTPIREIKIGGRALPK